MDESIGDTFVWAVAARRFTPVENPQPWRVWQTDAAWREAVPRKPAPLFFSRASNPERGKSKATHREQSRDKAMIRADEIRKGRGQIQFSLRVLETTQLRLKEDAVSDLARSDIPNRVRLSSFRVVMGRVSVVRALGQVLWAFLKLWLFER